MRLAFNPDAADGMRRPVTFNVLPDAEVENVIDAGGSVEVSLDPSLRFKAKTPDVDLTAVGVPVQTSAGIEASAVANAHAALGPFRYRVTRAVVSHTPVGMEYVRWRIERAASLDGAGPSLIVRVVRTPAPPLTIRV